VVRLFNSDGAEYF
jgi:serine/threonine protein kinase